MIRAAALVSGWSAVKRRLREQFGEDVFDSWFAKLEFEANSDEVISLSVPTKFIQNRLQDRYHDVLLDLCKKEFGDAVRHVEFSTRNVVQATQISADRSEIKSTSPSATLKIHRRDANVHSLNREGMLIGSPLDARYKFSNFVEGSSNCMALAASKCVADSGSHKSMGFKLLFMHSQVGLGKTHLLQSIAKETATHGRKAIYFTAEHFMFSFITALRDKTAISFKKNLRSIDVLLVDDLQFLHGQQVQQEFGHTLNCLIDGARQVVVAADRPFAELDSIGERVRSRLAGGFTAEITLPDLDLRQRTVRRLIEDRLELLPAHRQSLSLLSDDIVDYIAHNISSNGRDLDGAVTRMIAHTQLSNTPITLPIAEHVLRDLIRTRNGTRPTMENIQRLICSKYKVTKSDLLSSRRTKAIVRPRQVAIYLSKMLTPSSLPEIGKSFGNRDHATVLHSVRKIEHLMDDDHKFASEVNEIRHHLESCDPHGY